MNACAAEKFCQRYEDKKGLLNGTNTIEAECELCLKWYHCDCISFEPEEISAKSSDIYLKM